MRPERAGNRYPARAYTHMCKAEVQEVRLPFLQATLCHRVTQASQSTEAAHQIRIPLWQPAVVGYCRYLKTLHGARTTKVQVLL